MQKRLRHTFISLLPITCIAAQLAHGQATPKIQQKSESSACSNIVALAGNVNVNCSNLTREQREELARIPAILHKILANQLPTDQVMKKLDDILEASKHPMYDQTCVGSACAQGVGANAVFNQYGAKKYYISDEQIGIMADGLKRFSGLTVELMCERSRKDIPVFREQLKRAFDKAGIYVNGACIDQYSIAGADSSGITIMYNPQYKSFVQALEVELSKVGIVQDDINLYSYGEGEDPLRVVIRSNR